MKIRNLLFMGAITILAASCNNNKQEAQNDETQDTFKYKTEQFADVKILRYQIPGFNELSLNQKKLL